MLLNQSFDALYQVLTEYEHDISVLCSKSMYYRQGLFVELQNTDYEQGTFVSYWMPVLYKNNMFVVRCCQGEVRKEDAAQGVG